LPEVAGCRPGSHGRARRSDRPRRVARHLRSLRGIRRMKLLCAPETFVFPAGDDALHVVLYGQSGRPERGSAGDAARYDIVRAKLEPAPRAWDLLSIALSVVTADIAALREHSPDGWTREVELE